jgi:hypothetical protein
MPTRKQRRRREKELRHEYVWEDAEGNELDPENVKEKKGESPQRPTSARTGAREPQPPSWPRSLKRGLIFAPIMFIVVMLLSSNVTLAEQIIQTALIVGIFIPFSFFLDSVMWRSYKRRVERAANGGRGS